MLAVYFCVHSAMLASNCHVLAIRCNANAFAVIKHGAVCNTVPLRRSKRNAFCSFDTAMLALHCSAYNAVFALLWLKCTVHCGAVGCWKVVAVQCKDLAGGSEQRRPKAVKLLLG